MNSEFLTVGDYIPIKELSPHLVEDQINALARFSHLSQRQQDYPEGLDLQDRLTYLYHPRYHLARGTDFHPLSPIFDSFYMVVASIAEGSLGPLSPTPQAEVAQKEILAGLTEVMRMVSYSGSGNLSWPKPIYYQTSWREGIWKSTKPAGNSLWVISYTPNKRRLSFTWYQYNFDQLVDLPTPDYLTASFWNRIYALGDKGIIHNGFQVERKGWEVRSTGFLQPSKEKGRSLLNDYIGPQHLMEIASGSIEDCLALQRALMRRLNVGCLEPTMPSPEQVKAIRI